MRVIAIRLIVFFGATCLLGIMLVTAALSGDHPQNSNSTRITSNTATSKPTPPPGCWFCQIKPPDYFREDVVTEVDLGGTKASSKPGGTAYVKKTGTGETNVTLEVKGLRRNRKYFVYTIDENGVLSQITSVTPTTEIEKLETRTNLDSFMLLISPEPDLTSLASRPEITLITGKPDRFSASKIFPYTHAPQKRPSRTPND